MRRSLLSLPAIGVIASLLIAPLGVLFLYSVWRVQLISIVRQWNVDNYREAISEYGMLIVHTAEVGAVAAAVTTSLAVPLAYAIRYKLGRVQDAVVFLLLLALFGGYLVRIYAWKTILGENGIINSALEGVGLINKPIAALLFSRLAVVITFTNFLLPIAVLPIYSALQNLPLERLNASHDLGAGRTQTTLRLVLPEIAVPIFASFALCSVLAAGDWVTPTLVGGTQGLMVGQVIEDQFGAVFNWSFGAALAFSSAAFLIVALMVASVLARLLSGFRRGV